MAIIVEDGTAKDDAESFISVSDADSYHTDRGNTSWTGASGVKEAALRRATEYMEANYRMRWFGFRLTVTQALSWPRSQVPLRDAPYGYGHGSAYVAIDVVPVEVQRACAELALQALAGDLNPALDRTTVEETVGPITVKYDKDSPEYKRFRSIDMLLTPYLQGSSVSVGLIRT